MEEHQIKTIRVVLAGMGWGAPKLGLALDEPVETDIIKEVNGIEVAFEAEVINHVANITLDFEESEAGEGLVIVGNDLYC